MTLTYPLVNLSTRAAVASRSPDLKGKGKDESRSIHAALLRTLQQEGVAGLYSGLSSSLLGIGVTNGIYYACYEEIRAGLLRRRGGKASAQASLHALTTVEGIMAGLIAGQSAVPVLWARRAEPLRLGHDAHDEPNMDDPDRPVDAIRHFHPGPHVNFGYEEQTSRSVDTRCCPGHIREGWPSRLLARDWASADPGHQPRPAVHDIRAPYRPHPELQTGDKRRPGQRAELVDRL